MKSNLFKKKLEGFHTVEVDGERLVQGSDLEIIIKKEGKMKLSMRGV